MPAYLTDQEFRLRCLLPTSVLDDIELATPGWLAAQLAAVADDINAKLAKRYNVPFAEPYPSVVQQWSVHIVSLNAWLKRGISATDETFQEYKAKSDRAYTELAEAADSTTGLYELPIVDTDGKHTTAIKRGSPVVYSEQSPYVGFTRQARTARREDDSGTGSGSGR